MKKKSLFVALSVAAATMFASLAGLNLAWSSWFNAGVESLTQGDTLGAAWTAPSSADDVSVGNARIDIDTDEELVYTPAASSSSQIVRCDMSVYPTLHGGFPDEAPADDVQTMLIPYTNNGVVAWAACVKVGGETNWVSLTGVTPVPNSLTDVRIEFDYRSTPQVSFSVKSGGVYVTLQDENENTWFDTLNAKTAVSSIAFTGEGSIASLAGANGYVVDPGSVAIYGGTGYSTFEAAIAAAAADGYSAGPATLLADVSWTPAATGAYQIDVNGNTLTINGAGGSWSGTTYTVTALNYYYWIGGASGAWDDGANWSHVPGGAAAGEYPNAFTNYAFFTAAATINLSNKITTVRSIFTDGELTLLGDSTGNSIIRTAPSSNYGTLYMGGSGKVRLAGVALYASYGTSTAKGVNEITNALEIVAGTTNILKLAGGATDRHASLHVRGALSGAGTLIARSNSESANYQIYFHGGASEFSGVFCDQADGDSNSTRVQFTTAASVSEDATYNLSMTYGAAGYNGVLRAGEGGTTYRMGALNGNVQFRGNKSGTSGQLYGYTLEVGGNNEDCAFGGYIGHKTCTSPFRKVGTGDLTFSGDSSESVNKIEIANGTFIVGSANTMANSSSRLIFTGGAFSIAEGVSVDPVAKFSSESTAAVVFDDRGSDRTWTGELTDARVPFGFTKKGVGTLTLTTAPSHTTKTTVEGGVLVVPQGTTISALSCAGGKLTVPFTGTEDETEVLTITSLAEGSNYDALTNALAVVGATISVTSGESGYTVKATRTPQTYTWTGAALDGNWNTPGNWSADGVIPAMGPTLSDTVVFPSEGAPWNTTLQGDVTVAAVQFNGSTTLSNALIACASVSAGESVVVTLGAGAGFMTANSALELDGLSFAITAATESPARFYRYTNDFTIASSCTFTGTGAVTFGTKKDLTGIEISADMSEFAGTVNIPKATDSAYRSNTSIVPAASSAAAVWNVNNNSKDQPFFKSAGDYEFGSMNGSVSHNYASLRNSTAGYAYRMVIGALGQDDALGGRFFSSTYAARVAEAQYQAVLRKVGSGELTFYGREVARLEVNGGTLTITNDAPLSTSWTVNGNTTPYTEDASAAAGTWYATISFGGDEGGTLKLGNEVTADLSTNFVGSTTPIAIDTEASRTWAGVIPASNVGGLTKKGAGTLTLSAVPLYSGVTTVEEGSLIVPEGTTITLNALRTDNAPVNATIVGYGYPAGTTLTGAESVRTFDKPLDVANVVAIDLSGATLVPRQAFVIATATEIQNFNANNIVLTLPEGTDPTLWRLAAANGELRLSPRRVGVAIRLQ